MIKNNRYIDVDINFTRNSFNNDVSKVVDMTAIQQAVLSIVLTSKGEKPLIMIMELVSMIIFLKT